MESAKLFDEKDFLACCGSTKFAREMVLAGPFSSCQHAIDSARDIWFNKVDVYGWLQAFEAHPKIGESPSQKSGTSASFSNWSKGEQSTALATATNSSLQELVEWNVHYRQKFGIVFLIFASGRSTSEILEEMKRRFENRPLVEFEIAAQEQMKITELRLSKLFSAAVDAASKTRAEHSTDITKAGEDRMTVIGAHLRAASEVSVGTHSQAPPRTRPPITTHILDVARGSPATGIEVLLEFWRGDQPPSVFHHNLKGEWIHKGRTITDKDGRCGSLFGQDEIFDSGLYRISFNTGTYNPNGFFPYVSIVFEVKESQRSEHFHVPLLLSPFAFSTYRGS